MSSHPSRPESSGSYPPAAASSRSTSQIPATQQRTWSGSSSENAAHQYSSSPGLISPDAVPPQSTRHEQPSGRSYYPTYEMPISSVSPANPSSWGGRRFFSRSSTSDSKKSLFSSLEHGGGASDSSANPVGAVAEKAAATIGNAAAGLVSSIRGPRKFVATSHKSTSSASLDPPQAPSTDAANSNLNPFVHIGPGAGASSASSRLERKAVPSLPSDRPGPTSMQSGAFGSNSALPLGAGQYRTPVYERSSSSSSAEAERFSLASNQALNSTPRASLSGVERHALNKGRSTTPAPEDPIATLYDPSSHGERDVGGGERESYEALETIDPDVQIAFGRRGPTSGRPPIHGRNASDSSMTMFGSPGSGLTTPPPGWAQAIQEKTRSRSYSGSEHSYSGLADEKSRRSFSSQSISPLFRFNDKRTPSLADSVASGKYSIVHRSDHISVSNRIPEMDPTLLKRHRIHTATTLLIVIAGWLILILIAYMFKALAVRNNIIASDATAVFVKTRPTFTTQIFNVAGNMIAELNLILWEASISYFARRRLAYGNRRTELLSWSAWAEMKRAGYTFSRRRLSWPVYTFLVWFGFFFVAPAWTTLLTPIVVTKDVQWNLQELDFLNPLLPRDIVTNWPSPGQLEADMSASQFNVWILSTQISCATHGFGNTNETTFTLANGQLVQPCAAFTNPIDFASAGLAKLRSSLKEARYTDNAIFNSPLAAYKGGTVGVTPLGPNGTEPGPTLNQGPASKPSPDGYEFNYTTTQQGYTAEVECRRPAPSESLLTWTWDDTRPTFGQVNISCPGIGSVLGYQSVGNSEVVVTECPFARFDEANLNYHTIYFKDMNYVPPQPIMNGANWNWGGDTSLLGGDMMCAMKFKVVNADVQYTSTNNQFSVTPRNDGIAYVVPERLESLTLREAFAQMDDYEKATSLWLLNVTLVHQNTLNGLFALTNSAPYMQWPNSTYEGGVVTQWRGQPFNTAHSAAGLNLVMASLASFGKVADGAASRDAAVNPAHLATYLQGVIEYSATVHRETVAYFWSGGGVDNIDYSIRGKQMLRTVNGTWTAQTVGWGDSQQGDLLNSQVVYISFIPMILFAMLSIGLLVYSHIYDSPHGAPTDWDCDPSDWTDAVIAASQGGLHTAFHPDALRQHKGRGGARKVKVKLGAVYHQGEDRARMGFVDVPKDPDLAAHAVFQ